MDSWDLDLEIVRGEGGGVFGEGLFGGNGVVVNGVIHFAMER